MMVKKNVRPNPQKTSRAASPSRKARIAISNVMLMCNSCNRPVRVGHEYRGDQTVRACKNAAIRWRSKGGSWHLAFST